jgi:sugar phosphate isomerase/epimerase
LISTEIASFRKTINDDFEIVKLLKQAGFTAYDFSMSNAQFALEFLKDDSCYDFAKKLRKFADDIGIVCNQTHAPFPTLKRDDEWNKTMLSALKRSIKVSSILGAKICVVHPGNLFSIEENTALYRELLPIAKECNINKNLTWHISRHTFATLALTKGMSIESVSKILGHTNINTTQIYAKIINEKLTQEFEVIDKKLRL